MTDPRDIGAIRTLIQSAVIARGLKLRTICVRVEMDHPQVHPNIGCASAWCEIDTELLALAAEPGIHCIETLQPWFEAIKQKNTELCRKAACKPKRSGKKKP